MKIIECPRDAMQGVAQFIPTSKKAQYLNLLLKVGFHTLDFGSFVSPKAIPQMKDTAEVLSQLNYEGNTTSLLAIIANVRGAEEAASYEQITYLGFPLSISETFQMRNTNKSIPEALDALNEIKNVCLKNNKKLVTYISMGFGNPYGDPYEISMVAQFMDILLTLGTDVISLADTVGVAEAPEISSLFETLTSQFPAVEIGVHLHSNPKGAIDKIKAAYGAGCRRFDGALKGFGGCPMAKDELVGNIATETIITFLKEQGEVTKINDEALVEALAMTKGIFPNH